LEGGWGAGRAGSSQLSTQPGQAATAGLVLVAGADEVTRLSSKEKIAYSRKMGSLWSPVMAVSLPSLLACSSEALSLTGQPTIESPHDEAAAFGHLFLAFNGELTL